MVSTHRNCARQTEEVVRRSTRNAWSGSYRQVRSKFIALIANFLCQTLRWILSLSPLSSPVLEPNLRGNDITYEKIDLFSTLLSQKKQLNVAFNKRRSLKRLPNIYLTACG